MTIKENERLAKLEQKIDDLIAKVSEHIDNHKSYVKLIWTSLLGMIITLVIFIIEK